MSSPSNPSPQNSRGSEPQQEQPRKQQPPPPPGNNDGGQRNQLSTSPPSSSPLSQSSSDKSATDQDFFSSIRKTVDESISSALHSIFGLPSILQPPSSSNWIMNDDDRDEQYRKNRRTGSRDDDDDNNNGDASAGPRSAWPPSSSSSASNPEGGSSSSSASSRLMDGSHGGSWESRISSMLLSLGLHSTHILEQGFKTVHNELSQLAEKQEKMRQHHQQILEQGLKQDGRKKDMSVKEEDGEFIPSRHRRRWNRRRQFPDHEHSKFWAEFFGEDMFGHNRTHPLFSSFFDEFLPEDPFGMGRHGSGTGGGQSQTAHRGWGTEDDAFFAFFDAKLRQAFRESMRQAEQMHDMHLLRQGFPASNVGYPQYDPAEAHRWALYNPRAASDAVIAAIEQRQQHERLNTDQNKQDKGQQDDYGILWKSSKEISTDRTLPSPPLQEKREPHTELDLYDYFNKDRTDNQQNVNDKQVISTCKTSVTSQDSNGVVTTRTIQELRFSDGSVERVESTDEGESRQVTHPSINDNLHSASVVFPSFNSGARFHEAFEKERQRIKEQERMEHGKCPWVHRETKPITAAVEDNKPPDRFKDSSRSSVWKGLFWASENK